MSLFGGTYGGLGGQVAANEAKGFRRGWQDVEDLRDQSTRRKIMQQQWNISSEMQKTKLWDAYASMQAKQQVAMETNALSKENIQAINAKLDNVAQGFNKAQGMTIKNMVNDFLSTPAERKQYTLDAIKNQFKQNPALTQKFGPNFNPDTMRRLELGSEVDKNKAYDYMSKIDPMFAYLPKEQQERLVQNKMNEGNLIEADGKVVDMEGFAMGIGALNTMDGKQKALYEANKKGSKGVSKATSKVAPIEEPGKDSEKAAESSSKKELKDKNEWRKDIQVVRAVELLQGWQVFKGLGAQ